MYVYVCENERRAPSNCLVTLHSPPSVPARDPGRVHMGVSGVSQADQAGDSNCRPAPPEQCFAAVPQS